MRKRLLGLFIFIIAVAALIGSLKMLNWTPGILQEGLPSIYTNIEEVRSRLRIKDIRIPSYYPQGLHWPPARITAQSRPYIMVLMEFRRQEDSSVSLAISQTALPHPPPKMEITMIQTDEQVNLPIKGRIAQLEVGRCRNSEQCCRVSWNEPPYHIEVVMMASPAEVVRIAESMTYEQSQ
jgi:hypothetical protein